MADRAMLFVNKFGFRDRAVFTLVSDCVLGGQAVHRLTCQRPRRIRKSQHATLIAVTWRGRSPLTNSPEHQSSLRLAEFPQREGRSQALFWSASRRHQLRSPQMPSTIPFGACGTSTVEH
jgi:hypothetical protein